MQLEELLVWVLLQGWIKAQQVSGFLLNPLAEGHSTGADSLWFRLMVSLHVMSFAITAP
jgi:hypothetical protein